MAKEIHVKITGDSKDLERALSRSQKKTSGFGDAMAKASKGALIGLSALGVGAFAAVKAASNLDEQMNKTSVVFGSSAKAVQAWSRTTAESLGISQRAALEATGTFGNMLVPMGIARGEAAKMSVRMVKLAADMASFNNASPEETLDALRAGLAGETEPLRRFGVFLNEARIQQEALNLGLVKGKEKLTAAEKATATYSIIMKDTADTQGDFARTSDSLANQERILKAQIEDTGAALGNALLPAARDVLGITLDLVNATRDHGREAKILAAAAAALAAGIIGLNTSLKIYNASALLAIRATKALRIAMAVTPWAAAAVAAGFLIEHLINQEKESDEASQATERLTAAVRGYHTAISEGKNARLEVRDANLRLEAAEIAVSRAIKDRTRVDKDSKSTALDRREADLRVAQAMNERRDAEAGARIAGEKFLGTQRDQIHANDRVGDNVRGLADIYRNRLTKEIRGTTNAGKGLGVETRRVNVSQKEGQDIAREYANRLRGMAKVAGDSSPKLARLANVAADLASAWGRVVSLPQAREFVARFRVITTVEEHRSEVLRNRQHGGPVQRGQAYVVGERRPEVFVPETNGRIIPRVQRPAMAGNGGGGFPGDPVVILTSQRVAKWLQNLNGDYSRQNGGRSIW